jgi:hypothetical protein
MSGSSILVTLNALRLHARTKPVSRREIAPPRAITASTAGTA